MAAKLLEKINQLNQKLLRVEQVEKHLDKLVKREDKDIKELKDKEDKVEKSLIKLGTLEVKRSHVMELIRGMAGAFLGVGLGQAVGGSVSIAEHLPWVNTLGILAFVLIFVGLIIYRKDKAEIEDKNHNPWKHVIVRLTELYIIAIVVQLLGLILFNNFPGWNETLAKALIIGSYSAMSSAVAFTLI